jgi:prepilin-type N-terminal cleavage/methylation domain-containing protein
VTSARRDDGFTLVELSITSVLLAALGAALVSMLVSQTNAERDISRFATNQEEIRQAVVAMQQDLRSAEPLTEVSNPLDLRYRVDLKVYDDVASTTPVQIRWRLDATNDELRREQVDSSDVVIATTHRLRGVVNENVGAPLFTYYDADDAAFSLDDVGITSGTVVYCTVRVRIDLRAAPNGGRAPVAVVSDVQLRNRLPGAEECPN